MAGFVQPEAPSLRYPDQLPLHATLTLEQAFKFLSSAPQMSMNRPYSWGYIDRPPEGQLLLLFLPNSKAFPNDGIRWQEEEVMHPVSAGGNREMEVYEVKAGFAPGIDELAWRVRRRFRLSKGGHPQLQLVHYSRGQNRPIIPSLMSQPVRAYPLPHITQPPVVVLGDKKPFPPGMPGNMSNIPLGTMSVAQQQALVASQVGTMDRREREQRARESSGNPAAAANAVSP
ncbi:hypothetical protein FISHEDRAFT_69890 [Fistulina hepatica ATCC 64428]|uniref:SWI/SNF and RSC complexes subunit Ssr4 N-terminal domain-containing protein n=1 Tax=Fistulina hepatica ATCC 64428 TaxID=1128425 RepID=A0A0D7AMD5_9AGAR|nr:hypothetical protein FISHEDRAFT_69890 [Fistulina hepatica ATCC 64428]